jgi:Gas vesicle protein G
MDPLTLLFRLPFLPLTGVIKLAEAIQQEAERELHDPARIRRELEEVQRQKDAGEISQEESAEREDRLAGTMVTGRPGPPRLGRR